jgi:aminoglycoside phosphotransferase family enzyme/predicted kinase
MTAPATVAETHVSLLFFVGDRVYKLRKPVEFGFLDFRDRATRQADCQREVMLNRRLAPDVYLGVADIELNGELVDHMVVMRRLPDELRLATLARQGADIDEPLRQVAMTMVSFHEKAHRSAEISAAATGAAVRAGWEANFAETAPFVGTILDPVVDGEIRTLAARWIEGRQSLFAARIAARRVCDGHGDLEAEDVFCLEDGVRILDCVEFSDVLRYCDVSADVAFLAMDLERLGRPREAGGFLAAYKELAGDRFPDSLVHHYCASRAYVRTKVSCLRAAQGLDSAEGTARQLHELTLSHLRRAMVKLVLIGGVPGSGKSTLARGLADLGDWVVLRSDEIRRELQGPPLGPAPEFGAGRYSRSATGAVYDELLRRAERSLESGESVVLDATWTERDRREAARALADRTSSDLVELRCDVATAEAQARIARRLSEQLDASEATPALVAVMAERMEPWPSATVIDTSGAPEAAVALAMESLRRQV